MQWTDMMKSRVLAAALAALTVAGCHTPARSGLPTHVRVARAPTVMTTQDLETPKAIVPYAPAVVVPAGDSVVGVYPKALADSLLKAPLAADEPERWTPSASAARALHVAVRPTRVYAGLGPVGGTVAVRGTVWPLPARVERVGADRAEIATEWLDVASLDGEMRCAAALSIDSPVRLVADVATEGGAVMVRARMEVKDRVDCYVNQLGVDRISSFGTDVWMAVSEAARRTVPLPMRGGR